MPPPLGLSSAVWVCTSAVASAAAESGAGEGAASSDTTGSLSASASARSCSYVLSEFAFAFTIVAQFLQHQIDRPCGEQANETRQAHM